MDDFVTFASTSTHDKLATLSSDISPLYKWYSLTCLLSHLVNWIVFAVSSIPLVFQEKKVLWLYPQYLSKHYHIVQLLYKIQRKGHQRILCHAKKTFSSHNKFSDQFISRQHNIKFYSMRRTAKAKHPTPAGTMTSSQLKRETKHENQAPHWGGTECTRSDMKLLLLQDTIIEWEAWGSFALKYIHTKFNMQRLYIQTSVVNWTNIFPELSTLAQVCVNNNYSASAFKNWSMESVES